MNNRELTKKLTLAPYGAWAALFIVVPLIFVAYYAFTDDAFRFTTENITRFFTATSALSDDSGAVREVRTYLLIFWRSLKLAILSTLICLLLGYPFAYMISQASPRTQSVLITLIMIPMWMNFLIRTYAWMTILQDTGIFNNFLSLLGLGRIQIIGTETAVVIGMVYDYFPYMILPLYSVMAKMDTKLFEAARDLGCSGAGVLRRVILPLSVPGILNGVWAPDQGLFPAWAGGLYSRNNTMMIVSRGLARESTRVPRWYNRPELVTIDLRPVRHA